MHWATIGELAELIGGEVVGDKNAKICNALPLQDAVEHCLTLVDHERHIERFESSSAVAAVTRERLSSTKPQWVVDDIHVAFSRAIQHLRPTNYFDYQPTRGGVSTAAEVDPTAAIGSGTTIQAGCTIGAGATIGSGCVLHANVQIMDGCSVGDNCVMFPSVTLYPGTVLGDRVLLHASVVLGAFGFGYRMNEGRHCITSQQGWVEIGDDVEIGVASTVDRGTYGPTRIGTGTKIDNQVQVGHNCHIGQHNLICAQVGIAGSCSTGDYVVLAGQVGIADHIHIEDRVQVGAQSGVMQNLKSGAVVLGTPARPSKRTMQEVALVSRLPSLRKEVRALQRQLDTIQQAANDSGESSDGHQRDAA